jgi:SAM-dependent methyltransferase
MSRIPRVLHYTFGMAADFGGKPWSLVHYVCLKSAIAHIRPEQVFFYYEYEPAGPWWALSRELVSLVPITAPREIFGNPLRHVAHRADVVRLQKLIEHGGIYLDADVLVQRDFDDLLGESVVLGREGQDGKFGMANAVILAEPNAPFLVRWLEAYRSFRSQGQDAFWSEHSVTLPARLALDHPGEITVLSEKAFFWPLWTPEHLDWIFRSNTPIPLEQTYANHLWEATAWPALEDLTPGRVRARDTNFHRWARSYLEGLPDHYGAPSLARRLSKGRARLRGQARWIKQKLQGAARKLLRLSMSQDQWRRRIFQDIYKYNLWGRDDRSPFYSGVGSRGDAARTYVEQIAPLIEAHAAALGRAPVVVDLGCGDFQIGAALTQRLPGITYIGCDIVPELIAHNTRTHASERVSFRQLDMVVDALPAGDICLVRQVLQHLSNREIADILGRMGGYGLIYVTEGHPVERTGPVNPDKAAGANVRFDWQTGRGRGVELDQPPFGVAVTDLFSTLAPPHEVIVTQRVILDAAGEG